MKHLSVECVCSWQTKVDWLTESVWPVCTTALVASHHLSETETAKGRKRERKRQQTKKKKMSPRETTTRPPPSSSSSTSTTLLLLHIFFSWHQRSTTTTAITAFYLLSPLHFAVFGVSVACTTAALCRHSVQCALDFHCWPPKCNCECCWGTRFPSAVCLSDTMNTAITWRHFHQSCFCLLVNTRDMKVLSVTKKERKKKRQTICMKKCVTDCCDNNCHLNLTCHITVRQIMTSVVVVSSSSFVHWHWHYKTPQCVRARRRCN